MGLGWLFEHISQVDTHSIQLATANKQNQTSGKASNLEVYQGAANETYKLNCAEYKYHKLESSMWERGLWGENGWGSLCWGIGIGAVCRWVNCGGPVFSRVCSPCGKFLVLGLLAGDGTRRTSGLLWDNLGDIESGWIGDGSWRWRGERSCSVSSSFMALCMSSTSENKEKKPLYQILGLSNAVHKKWIDYWAYLQNATTFQWALSCKHLALPTIYIAAV